MNRFLVQDQNSWDSLSNAFVNAYVASAAKARATDERQTADRRPTDANPTGKTDATDGRNTGRQSNDRRATDGRQTGQTQMQSKDLVGVVKNFEGFYANPYGDHGQMSIGYGTRAKDGDSEIDDDEATRRLNDELAMHRDRVVAHDAKYGYKLTPHQVDALTSFDYNTGSLEQLTGGGKRTTQQIADAMLEYNKASGKKLPGLVNRRNTERDIFLNGY